MLYLFGKRFTKLAIPHSEVSMDENACSSNASEGSKGSHGCVQHSLHVSGKVRLNKVSLQSTIPLGVRGFIFQSNWYTEFSP